LNESLTKEYHGQARNLIAFCTRGRGVFCADVAGPRRCRFENVVSGLECWCSS